MSTQLVQMEILLVSQSQPRPQTDIYHIHERRNKRLTFYILHISTEISTIIYHECDGDFNVSLPVLSV